MTKTYSAYIITNIRNTVLYAGITDNLTRRVHEHKNKLTPGFTSKYNVNKLVWYEHFQTPQEAIAAEKKIKGWRREKKLNLIKSENPNFEDLME